MIKMKPTLTGSLIVLILFSAPLILQDSAASHSATASPSGGSYAAAQPVILNSSIPSGLIFYSTDGSDPSTSGNQYNGTAILVAETTTLKFMAVDPSDNHTSAIFAESYIIDNSAPTVVNTQPENNGRRVQIASKINVTFSESMNEVTINADSFIITNEIGDQVFGSITYNSVNNTASFNPDEPLIYGLVYTAELTDEIQDELGNALEGYLWSFTAGGQLRIFIRDVESFDFVPGSAFTITPNPFTLNGSLVVEDNGLLDSDASVFGSVRNGIIVVDNVHNDFITYTISESTPPSGYSRIWGDAVVTVVEALECDSCNPISSMTVDNLSTNSSITDVDNNISVPAPYLNQVQFELYRDNVIVGRFNGIQGDIDPTTDVQNPNPPLPSAQIATSTTIDELLAITLFEAFNFLIPASPSLSGQEIFDNFLIPTYPGPVEGVAGQVIYAVPAAVIPYEGSKNNFVLSPIIERVFPGEQLVIIQPSFVETNVAKVQRINMTFDIEATNVGFSFGITNTPPPGTPDPPLDAPALFLDIGFVGEGDFAQSSSFQSSPKIDVLVNKTLSGFPELPNGCPDFRLLFFNGDDWEEVQKLDPTGNFTDFCPFTLEPEHFSKFAVGGVKGQTIQTEQERDSSGGGGRSRSTAITQTPTGADVETSITTESGMVLIRFESVEAGSGQIKIDANELSVFEELFDTLAFLSQDDEHGMARIGGSMYATAGDVFDIDASAVMFSGKVDVTIPYDEETVMQFGPESAVKFIHFNEELGAWEDATGSVDESANTVTGTLESLSPVAAAIILEGANIEVDTTFVQVRSPEFAVSSGSLSMHVNLKNMRVSNQEYVMLAQIVDARGIAQHIDWQTGTLDGSQETDIGMTWQDLADGTYGVMVIILTDLDAPWFLSEPVSGQFDVRSAS